VIFVTFVSFVFVSPQADQAVRLSA